MHGEAEQSRGHDLIRVDERAPVVFGEVAKLEFLACTVNRCTQIAGGFQTLDHLGW